VLLRDDRQPRNVWNQHQAMLDAIAEGDGAKAEELGRQHIFQAADFMIGRLREMTPPGDDEDSPRKRIAIKR